MKNIVRPPSHDVSDVNNDSSRHRGCRYEGILRGLRFSVMAFQDDLNWREGMQTYWIFDLKTPDRILKDEGEAPKIGMG